jgi:tumor protein p53-inducible protein 3
VHKDHIIEVPNGYELE